MQNNAMSTPEKEDLYFEARKTYDYFRIEGETLDYNMLRGCLQTMARTNDIGKRRCVLVENNYRESLSLADLFRVIRDLPEIGFSQIHLAIADPNPGHADIIEFANDVAGSRGLLMKAFSSVPDAEGWLTGCSN